MGTRKPKAAEIVVAYKGFDKDMKCRGYQFEVGKTYTHDGDVAACRSGFHACEYPLHVLRYYPPGTSKFAVVEQSGALARHDEDSKIASSVLTVRAAIDLPSLIQAAVEYTTSRAKPVKGSVARKDNGAATASGRYGAATASGWSGAATASGEYGAATASGLYGAATASGWYGAATASGWSGAATASGEYGAATASHATAVALASGANGRASGVDGAALFLVERDPAGNVIAAWAGIVGKSGIKPNTYYTLKNGKPTEAV
jgi:hypothetical protein